MKFEVEDLKKVHMLPGETLIVKCKPQMAPVVRKYFRKHFEKIFPNNKLLFILESMEIYKIISEVEE